MRSSSDVATPSEVAVTAGAPLRACASASASPWPAVVAAGWPGGLCDACDAVSE
jgi:hypothetical protein